MGPLETAPHPLKSALYVDFDNIYIGLSKSDPLAAERFASDPERWLAWLEQGLPQFSDQKLPIPRQRSILIRRCYPNPDAGFRRFRSFFTSAAFTVIDCPSLTRTGKNSSDIYMVMDILDALSHRTYFDEFIIFSGDSDFMPVLLRLRAHDRRTTTLAIDFMPPAYKAACDMVISEEQFIEEALGVTQDASNGGNGARLRVSDHVLTQMAQRVYQAVSNSGEVAGADLPDILKDFREFRDSTNWLGYGTSQRLAEVLASCEPRLQLVRLNQMMYKIAVKDQAEEKPLSGRPALPAQKQAAGQAGKQVDKPSLPEKIPVPAFSAAEKTVGQKPPPETPTLVGKKSRVDRARLREGILAQVKKMVDSSATPVLLARASQYVVNKLGPQVLETQWAGAGSFKRLLEGASETGLEITTQPEPGYIFDPGRHAHPAQIFSQGIGDPQIGLSELAKRETDETRGLEEDGYRIVQEEDDFDRESDEDEEEEYSGRLPSLEEFIRRVSRVTGAPDLAPQEYAQVFRGIVVELQKISTEEKGYNTYQSSKAISEWCGERGNPVSRSDVVMILKGIIFQDGVRFGKRPGSYTERELAGVVLSNIKALCRRSRLELSEQEHNLLQTWILGGLEERYPPEENGQSLEQPGPLTGPNGQETAL